MVVLLARSQREREMDEEQAAKYYQETYGVDIKNLHKRLAACVDDKTPVKINVNEALALLSCMELACSI